MATALQPQGVPIAELPSRSSSDDSLASRANEAAYRPNDVAALAIQQPTRIRGRRSPSHLPLRTGFRSFSGVATILVGEPGCKMRPETKYLVHKELLTAASPFFAAALNSTFAEGMDQTVRMPEEKPEIFEWFLQWLYTGTLKTATGRYAGCAPPTPTASSHHPPRHHDPLPTPEQAEHDRHTDGDLRNSAGSPKYFLLLDLFALSDRLLTTPLSNHILTTLARLSESTNSVPTPSDTWILYDGIRDTAPLRALVLDLFAYKKTDRLLETHRDDWHPRFLRDLCVKLKRPGPESIERHTLVSWRPGAWASSRACELCREVMQPGGQGERCKGCERVFCLSCLRHGGPQGRGGQGVGSDLGGCKPWAGKGMCGRYHEHGDEGGCG